MTAFTLPKCLLSQFNYQTRTAARPYDQVIMRLFSTELRLFSSITFQKRLSEPDTSYRTSRLKMHGSLPPLPILVFSCCSCEEHIWVQISSTCVVSDKNIYVANGRLGFSWVQHLLGAQDTQIIPTYSTCINLCIK
jgi:hypothetical protein